MTNHRLQRWQLRRSLKQCPSKEHDIGLLPWRPTMGWAIQRYHAVSCPHQRLDQPGKLGRPPLPSMHQQNRWPAPPPQSRDTEAQRNALGAAQPGCLPVLGWKVSRRHELAAHAPSNDLRRQASQRGIDPSHQTQTIHHSAPQMTADLAARSTRSDKSPAPRARARANPPTMRARSAKALSASSGRSHICALSISRCSANKAR